MLCVLFGIAALVGTVALSARNDDQVWMSF
jgi:hypothetical protein